MVCYNLIEGSVENNEEEFNDASSGTCGIACCVTHLCISSLLFYNFMKTLPSIKNFSKRLRRKNRNATFEMPKILLYE